MLTGLLAPATTAERCAEVSNGQITITPGPADTTAPAIAIATPARGASYRQGKTIIASYSCTDRDDAVTSCSGTVPNGSPIDTRSPGAHSFTVSATDHVANRARTT